jgi:hypothetical protein
MSVNTQPKTDGVRALLAEPRYELMPFDSFGEQLTHLPDGAEVAITTSPTLGLEATVEWTEKAAAEGYAIVPHVAARYVEDDDHLDEVASRIAEAGVDDIFVPGGDRDEPASSNRPTTFSSRSRTWATTSRRSESRATRRVTTSSATRFWRTRSPRRRRTPPTSPRSSVSTPRTS